jgi:hypothetical protein
LNPWPPLPWPGALTVGNEGPRCNRHPPSGGGHIEYLGRLDPLTAVGVSQVLYQNARLREP